MNKIDLLFLATTAVLLVRSTYRIIKSRVELRSDVSSALVLLALLFMQVRSMFELDAMSPWVARAFLLILLGGALWVGTDVKRPSINLTSKGRG